MCVCVQEEYYATHQCFLTKRSLFLLVWNVKDGEAGLLSLRPWLENIEVICYNTYTGGMCGVSMFVIVQEQRKKQHNTYIAMRFTTSFILLYTCTCMYMYVHAYIHVHVHNIVHMLSASMVMYMNSSHVCHMTKDVHIM